MRLVLASNNARKLVELQTLLAPAGVELVAQSAFGVTEADEPHITFIENALAKARHAAHHVQGPAISDDSGLCVEALGGEPGVASARYAGDLADEPTNEPTTEQAPSAAREDRRRRQDTANNSLLLERMHDVADRRACFVSVLVGVRSADDPEPLVAVGRWYGEISSVPAGDNGFGYDALMFIPALGCSAAELTSAVKNAHSHRAIAAERMLRLMHEVWRLG